MLDGHHPTFDSIKNLPYLGRVLKETLRLMPPVAEAPGRQCSEDTPIPGTSFVIPKGAHVTLSLWSVHRDATHWPEPEKFDPDRFLPENVKARHPYAYMPFSAGRVR